MSKYVMLLLLLCLTVNQSTQGKIKNGYELEIEKVQLALCNLQQVLEEYDPQYKNSQESLYSKKQKVKSKIVWLTEYINYYKLTERLLSQFRSIAPDLYQQIDTIKDRDGRQTDVYIKFIPRDKMPYGVAGTTNISQSTNNQNTYCSEYGDYTVSVKIAILNKSLRLLAHELGHVNHQVPNLAAYVKYYMKNYNKSDFKLKGHNSQDPSGQQVQLFEKRFFEQLREFTKDNQNKIASPLVLLETVRKSPSSQVIMACVQNNQ